MLVCAYLVTEAPYLQGQYVTLGLILTPLLNLFQSEVAALESNLKTAPSSSSTVYLVPDATALCTQLHLLRRLVTTERMVIIIPIQGTLNKPFMLLYLDVLWRNTSLRRVETKMMKRHQAKCVLSGSWKSSLWSLARYWKLQKRKEIHRLYCWEGDLKEPSKLINLPFFCSSYKTVKLVSFLAEF